MLVFILRSRASSILISECGRYRETRPGTFLLLDLRLIYRVQLYMFFFYYFCEFILGVNISSRSDEGPFKHSGQACFIP